MKYTKIIQTMFLIILFSLSVFADSNSQSYTFDAQYSKYGTSVTSSPFSNFEYNGGGVNFVSYGWGTEQYPKMCDVDNDGDLEILSFLKGDENIRALNYNFETDEIEVQHIFDITPTGYTLDDVVCVQGVTDDFNVVLAVMHSNENVKIAEYHFDPSSDNLNQFYEYMNDPFLEFEPLGRLGCYESSSYYYCYYYPQLDSNFNLIRLTNSVSSNVHAYDLNETDDTLFDRGVSAGNIESVSSSNEQRLSGVYFDGIDLLVYAPFDDRLKQVGHDESQTDNLGYNYVEPAPFPVGPDEIFVQRNKGSNAGEEMYLVDIDLFKSYEHSVWNGESFDDYTIGPLINGNLRGRYDYDELLLVNPIETGETLPVSEIMFGMTNFYSRNGNKIIMNFGGDSRVTNSDKSRFLGVFGLTNQYINTDLGGVTSGINTIVGGFMQLKDLNYNPSSPSNSPEACFLSTGGPTYSGCFDINTSSSIKDFTWTTGEYEFPIALTQVNGKTAVFTYEIVNATLQYYYADDLSTSYDIPVSIDGSSLLNNNGNLKGNFMVIDINDDGLSELVVGGLTNHYVASLGVNTIPELLVFEESGFGHYQENCLTNATTNTTIKFRECLGDFDCSYYYDQNPEMYERVCSTCGGTQSLTCGDWSLLEPSVTCSNVTSTQTLNMSFEFYRSSNVDIPASLTLVQSNAEGTDLTYNSAYDVYGSNHLYQEIVFNDNPTCDVVPILAPDTEEIFNNVSVTITPTTNETTSSSTSSETYDNPDDLLNGFLGGVSTLWKIVIGFGIIFGITLLIAQSTNNLPPFAIALVMVMATILVTALGFIPAYILILISLIAIISVAVAKMTGGD